MTVYLGEEKVNISIGSQKCKFKVVETDNNNSQPNNINIEENENQG